MRGVKSKKSLLNKQKFSSLAREKRRWLENLSTRKALWLEESMLSSLLIWEWRKNFSQDSPICLKNSLQKRK